MTVSACIFCDKVNSWFWTFGVQSLYSTFPYGSKSNEFDGWPANGCKESASEFSTSVLMMLF